MALIHLIYVSTAREEFDTAELERILESASRHNSPQDITGMLLYAGGSFMQVLEGEESVVDETFHRVEEDRRHKDIFLIVREPIAQRNFAQWRMGFKRLGVEAASAHPAYASAFSHGFDVASLGAKPGLALDMLKTFAANQRN